MSTPDERPVTSRDVAIDVIKGIAIVGVLFQHAVSPADQLAVYGPLHLGLAVPMFVLLTGLNLAGSLRRTQATSLAAHYAGGYLRRRLLRLVPPLVIAWLVALVLGVVLDRLAFSPQMLLGSFPMPGPGDYYIPVLFQLVAVAPVVVWGMRRRPIATLAACFVIDGAFELLATQWHPLWSALADGANKFRYDVIGLRYLFVLAVGIWFALNPGALRRLRVPVALSGLAGAAYLLFEHRHPGMTWLGLPSGFERRTNLLTAGLVLCWAIVLPPLIRRLPGLLTRPAAELGRASYHVYLVQIVWFGALPGVSIGGFLLAVVGCSLLGVAFFRLVPGTPRRA